MGFGHVLGGALLKHCGTVGAAEEVAVALVIREHVAFGCLVHVHLVASYRTRDNVFGSL